MHFSSKISNSILTFFEQSGYSIDSFYGLIDVPEEFLRDSSSWISAHKMESFLSAIEHQIPSITNGDEEWGDNFLEYIGHQSPKLRAWGVLDGVLRMMEKPEDFFAKPERFLSYFISPEPPIGGVEKESNYIAFDVPVSSQQYPHVTQFLMSCLESLPAYANKELASAKWENNRIKIEWSRGQKSLFTNQEDPGRVINPQFLQSLVETLENNQKLLEAKNKELMEKNIQLEKAQAELQESFNERVHSEKLSSLTELASSVAHEINNPLSYTTSNVLRLSDYFTRAQQLITLLIAQDRQTRAVKEAMRRVDWVFVQNELPKVIQETMGGLDRVKSIARELSVVVGKESKPKTEKQNKKLNEVILNAIASVKPLIKGNINIDQHFFFDDTLSVYPDSLEQAFVNLLNNSVQSVGQQGAIRVTTRPKGNKAQIEITDTGEGMNSAVLEKIFTPEYTTESAGKGSGLGLSVAHSVVEMHGGGIQVESQPGKGSTFLIELPLDH